jgi:hypothetical protein
MPWLIHWHLTIHLMSVSAFISKNARIKHAGNHGDVTKYQEQGAEQGII